MNVKYLLRKLGLLKTPKYSIRFGAQNPFTGVVYVVRFEDGGTGMIRGNRNGTYSILPAQAKDASRVFITAEDAVECIYTEMLKRKSRNLFSQRRHEDE